MDSTKTVPQPETKLHFLDYWRIIRIRKTVILAVFLLVVITTTIVTFIMSESYSSTTRIRIEHNVADIGPLADRGYTPGSYDPYFIQTEFEVLKSEVILGKVVEDLKLNEEWGKVYNGGIAFKTTESIERLKRYMSLALGGRNTSIIEIGYKSDKPKEAADVANAIAQAYRSYRLGQSYEMMSNGIAALKKGWDEQQAQVHEAQTNVDRLRSEYKITESDPMSLMPTPTLSTENVRQLQSQLTTLKAMEVSQETSLERLTNLSRAQLREAIQIVLDQPDSELASLISQSDLAHENLIKVNMDHTESNKVYIAASDIVKQWDDKVNSRLDGILIALQAKLDRTVAMVNELSQQLENATTNDLAQSERSRPYYTEKQKLQDLVEFKRILGIKVASEKSDLSLPRNSMVEIIDRAVESHDAVQPQKALYIGASALVGLLVGVGLAFFIEYLDTSVKTIDDVERTLQAPVLGVIPQNVGFLLDEGAESPHAEAYRVLRTNLLFSRKDDKLNSIAIVSAGAGEGKSTTVMNLATVFAQNGSRVVVVDSDLRRPTLHKMLRVTNSLGLTNYLLKQNTLEQVIQTTSLPTLDFMASGKLPSSSMGILSSSQMKSLITELKRRYDFVFFDSPPIMGVSDGSILASEVDLTMQVIQYRRYPQPMNIRAKQMIEKVGGNLLGIVLNNINMSQDESYYYYSGYYQEYYSQSDDSAEGPEAGDKSKVDIKPKY
jgi:capsular exopolysaccharide synthesis family protein